jgi:surface protein
MYIDQHTGKVFFKEPTKYARKSEYNFKIIVEDTVGHVSTLDIVIHVKKSTGQSSVVEEEQFNRPLNNIEERQFFISTWKTDNAGISKNNQIIIPTAGDGYNYSVDWGDGTSSRHVTLDAKHSYAQAGVYDVKIFGSFPLLAFRKESDFNVSTIENDSRKLLKVKQWGAIEWASMGGAFIECTNMNIESIDHPNLSKVTDMSDMFHFAQRLNADISTWDTATVTDMDYMFLGASRFNQSLEGWNVSKVETMQGVFSEAKAFNQPLNRWDVSNVRTMKWMFSITKSFNQELNNWDTSKVKDMESMFESASSFNQSLDQWNVENVVSMESMFAYTKRFNQNLENWNIGQVKNMKWMFLESSALLKRPSWYH